MSAPLPATNAQTSRISFVGNSWELAGAAAIARQAATAKAALLIGAPFRGPIVDQSVSPGAAPSLPLSALYDPLQVPTTSRDRISPLPRHGLQRIARLRQRNEL